MRGVPPVLMMRGAKLSLMLRNGKLFPAALARGRPLTTPKPLSPPPNPLNNLQSLILIACLLACFLGVVQSKRSLLGGDPSLNYQESTKLFTVQQEVLRKSGSGTSFTSFASSSTAPLLFLSLSVFLQPGRRMTSRFRRSTVVEVVHTELPWRWSVQAAEKPRSMLRRSPAPAC